MNRDQRRHPERDNTPQQSPAEKMRDVDRPQDTLDPRAKNSGHGKKTADKWNQ
jgi:hypothetical protein